VHDKLLAMGLTGSERTTRRAVGAEGVVVGSSPDLSAVAARAGLWLQFDWATDRGCRSAHLVVLRLVGLVAVPGGAADL
jgi:hypothetical protein